MQTHSAAIGAKALSLSVTLGLAAATLATGTPAAKAKPTSARCNITVRVLRGRFSGSVTRSVPASCPFARKVAETSLRAIIGAGGGGNGYFSTRAYSPRAPRGYRLHCTATGNLYARRGISVDCRAGTGAGGKAVRVLYLASDTLALTPYYLDYAQEPLGSYTIGPEGVPWVPIYGNWVEHPDAVAQWGLREYAYGHRRPLMIAARWLANHERADGGIPYLFTLQDGGGVAEFAPWISAFAQGQAISELMRAYQLSGSPSYLRAALHASIPFQHPVPTGVTSWWGGHRWYEEYPAAQSQSFHVLNGFMFALVGLHDLATRSLAAWRLWRIGVRSLVAHIESFDVPDQHTQFYTALGPDHVPVDAYYAQTDAMLIRAIARWTHNPLLSSYAHRWTNYTH
jgi:hypothetical protein